MSKKLIIFSHHFINDFVLKNYNNVKELNPTWDIVPIGFPGYTLLPSSFVVDKNKYPTNFDIAKYGTVQNADWADPDLFLYDAYYQFPEYDEYFLYEYDTISNVSIDSFFDTSLDFFGNRISNPSSEDWLWAQCYRKYNPHNKHFNFIHGYGVSSCIYIKNHVVKQCYKEVTLNKHLYCNMLSEIRGGTLVNSVTSLKMGRKDIYDFISWTPTDITIDLTKEYFYHPFKG